MSDFEMPFVTTVSAGGPHEDGAYCAAWEVADIRNALDVVARTFSSGLLYRVARRDNMPQLDLVAMNHHMEITQGWPEGAEVSEEQDEEWCGVMFSWGASEEHP